MINTLFAIKKSMAQAYSEAGKRLPVTVLATPTHVISKFQTEEKDGYTSVQLAIGKKRVKANKPMSGHLKKANLDYKPRFIREVRDVNLDETVKEGTILELNTLVGAGDIVTVTATSKGKGFQGGVKRHGFAGGPKTHGQSDRHRAPGSIGQRTTPGRVHKGKRMAGHMGVDTVTVKNLKVLSYDSQTGVLKLVGPVPGSVNSLVRIAVTKKA